MHARSSRCSHDATTKILRKSIDASEAIRASSRRLGAAAFDFCVLHHHIELLSAPSPPPMQHNSGGIMLHQGELWESGHVTEEEEGEENIEYSPPLSLSLLPNRPRQGHTKRVDSRPGRPLTLIIIFRQSNRLS